MVGLPPASVKNRNVVFRPLGWGNLYSRTQRVTVVMVHVKGQQRKIERKQNPLNYNIYPMT